MVCNTDNTKSEKNTASLQSYNTAVFSLEFYLKKEGSTSRTNWELKDGV